MTDSPRYDLLLVSDNPSYRVAPQAIDALLDNMKAKRQIGAGQTVQGAGFTETYFPPGPAAHELLVVGSYDGEAAPFLELVARRGTAVYELEWGHPGRRTNFHVEIRGALFNDVVAGFRGTIQKVTRLRAHVFVREHAGLAPHLTASAGVAEAPAPGGRGGPPGLGTRVEEW